LKKVHLWSPAISAFGGGIGAFSRELAFGLRDLRYSVQLHSKVDATQQWQGFPLIGSGTFSPSLRSAGFGVQVTRSFLLRRPDIIITSHLNFSPLAISLSALTTARCYVAAHGIDVTENAQRIRRRSVARACRILAVSSWTSTRLTELWRIDSSRVTIFPNTFDENRFDLGPRPRDLIERYGIQPDEKVILTVCRLSAAESYKGYDRLIDALPLVHRACGKVRLVIVGKGDDEARVAAHVRAAGLESSVTMPGFVPESELPRHYRLADVFAMPSTGEGFGIVFLEAMGSGTPVLGGNADGSVDALDHGRLGKLVNPLSIPAIADGLISLLQKNGRHEWFDPSRLRVAVVSTFGRAAFRDRLAALLSDPCS
jgi:glycosyltransferase involved in cell wall biosynthesis